MVKQRRRDARDECILGEAASELLFTEKDVGKSTVKPSSEIIEASIHYYSSLFTNVLHDANCFSSIEEAQSIAESIVEDSVHYSLQISHDGDKEARCIFQEQCKLNLLDYNMSTISEEQASLLISKAFNSKIIHEDDSFCDRDEEQLDLAECQDDDDSINEEDNVDIIGEGECELCERYIMLTKHHLIPKSTWPRMKTKFENAVAAFQNDNKHRALIILGANLHNSVDEKCNVGDSGHKFDHFIPALNNIGSNGTNKTIKDILSHTCDICRPCHSAIHKAYDNMTLAENYNTVEKLIADATIYKFCKWASKQKPGKYAVR